ncbi:hypothetical protein EYF80_034064 [Liparis tanakae]|uniref:Uncharacterized protein n=1 Tax=Liparis tanakae TaxID=230148 RepID=A0A4Z2GQP3_9TELE|nr:hypothetical protein EYF80_034064 [Liparis tanakae]
MQTRCSQGRHCCRGHVRRNYSKVKRQRSNDYSEQNHVGNTLRRAKRVDPRSITAVGVSSDDIVLMVSLS